MQPWLNISSLKQIAIDGKQNASRIASRDNTTLCIGVDMYDIVKLDIIRLAHVKSNERIKSVIAYKLNLNV